MNFKNYTKSLLNEEQEYVHYHMILRFKVGNPIKDVEECDNVVKELIEAIDMKLLSGPHTVHVSTPGNSGISSVTIIETSHISLHTWDEQDPELMQLDVFSCKEFTKGQILAYLKKRFDIKDLEFIFLDRTNRLEVR